MSVEIELVRGKHRDSELFAKNRIVDEKKEKKGGLLSRLRKASKWCSTASPRTKIWAGSIKK